jgi:hypothetical protein
MTPDYRVPEDDHDSDSDYVYESDDIPEPYEYNTPRESDAEDTSEETGSTSGSLKGESTDSEYLKNSNYSSFIASLTDPPSIPQTGFRPLLDVVNEPMYSARDCFHEHIAGPNCTHLSGYNGNRISVEEMRGCCTFQYLCPKPASWQPQSDDEAFETEKDFDFFLSGLTDHVTSRDEPYTDVFPPRHECRLPHGDNVFWSQEEAAVTAMPFHPTCLEVYKRASLFRFGKIDIKALVDWYRLEADLTHFSRDFPRHEAVKRGNEQWWRHIRGDEWLAANPCFVPALPPIFERVKDFHPVERGYHREVFDVNRVQSRPMREYQPGDVFARLSFELRLEVLSYLGSRDIANLRLVTRVFRQLPQSLFHQLLLREAPWLWETWCPLPYSCWAANSRSKLERVDKMLHEQQSDLENWHMRVLSEGVSTNENEAAILALRTKGTPRIQAMEEEVKQLYQPHDVPMLPRPGTNWYQLFLEITRQWGSLKGLRNRERIWADCNYILDRIEAHRTAGRIGDGIVVDPVATFLAYSR